MDSRIETSSGAEVEGGGRPSDLNSVQPAFEDLRQWIKDRKPAERRRTNRELLDAARNARTSADRSRAADALRRQIKAQCAALIDHQFRYLVGHEVEDLTQEVFLRLLQSRTVEAIDPTPAYLRRIATNVVIDYLRSCKRRGLDGPSVNFDEAGEAGNVPDPSPSVEDEALGHLHVQEIRSVLRSSLSPVEADVLWLRSEGASHRDVAQALGVKEANARKHFERGTKRLKQLAMAGKLPV